MNLPELIQEQIDLGLVSKRKHPTEDLYILNYTRTAQYDWLWNPINIQCRGLIVDGDWNIIQRPFKKFFTYDQYKELDYKSLYGIGEDLEEIEEMIYFLDYPGIISLKDDGYMGILYWVGDEPYIATRGSFESEMAIRANKIIKKYDISNLDKSFTYLFEIIYPEGKIVVDYGDDEGLILLATIETKSGEDSIEEYDRVVEAGWPHYHDLTWTTLREVLEGKQRTDIEGYVLHYPFLNDFRIKFKYEEYLRLHRIVTNLTPRYIFEMYCDDTWQETLKSIPDEFHREVKLDILEIDKRYRRIERDCRAIIAVINRSYRVDIKSFALHVQQYIDKKFHGVLFQMYRGQSYRDTILKLIKKERKAERNGRNN